MSKISKLLFSITLMLLSTSGSALADGGRGHGYGHGRHNGGHVDFGIYFGAPYAAPYYPSPYYYPYSYYAPAMPYYPPVIITPAPVQPPVYIEQQVISPSIPQAAPAPTDTNYWYRCEKTDAYYPYVKECPGGWQKVVPVPPAQP
jgi:hypothetical protein